MGRLRERNIALAVGVPDETSQSRLAVVAVCGTECDSGSIQRVLDGGVRVEAFAPGDLARAVARVTAVVGTEDRLGVLLSEHTVAAVCLANRSVQVRAAAADSVKEVAAAVAAIGANVLVIGPNKCEPRQLGDMIEEFTRGGPRRCPAVVQEALGIR